MRVADIRAKLEQIPGAMVDVPPGVQQSGDEEGAISHTLFSPEGLLNQGGLLLRSSDPGDPPLDTDDPDDWTDAGISSFEPVFEWGAAADETFRRLGEASDHQIRQSVEEDSGSDALGHYLSFHVRGEQWGATIKLSGVAWLARTFFQHLPADDATRARLAFHAILQHELFHFATDVAVAQGEMSQRQAWWRPAVEQRQAMSPAYSVQEEMLANVWMLRAFRTALPNFKVKGKQDALKTFVAGQPVGYCDALSMEPEPIWWRHGLYLLVLEYATQAGHKADNPLLWRGGYDWASQFPVWPRIDWRDCAIHFVDDSARFGIPPGWLTHLSHLRQIEESDAFRKQLSELSTTLQKRWTRAKAQAELGLTNGHDFKPWPKSGPDIWSMRIDRNFRVHLEWKRASDTWIARKIGDHKSMGHG